MIYVARQMKVRRVATKMNLPLKEKKIEEKLFNTRFQEIEIPATDPIFPDK